MYTMERLRVLASASVSLKRSKPLVFCPSITRATWPSGTVHGGAKSKDVC